MHCPVCDNADTKVIDSRPAEGGMAIRRRRACEHCDYRFSTYEQAELLDLEVVKRDGVRQVYSRDKLERGLSRAFEKRPFGDAEIKNLIMRIEKDIQKHASKGEITSGAIGDIVMQALSEMDKVAYVRFASVYKQFEDASEFKKVIDQLN